MASFGGANALTPLRAGMEPLPHAFIALDDRDDFETGTRSLPVE
jgi:hypothetical protein